MLTDNPVTTGQGSGKPRNRRWWLAYHVAIAPYGILATTWLLAGRHDSSHWLIWNHLDAAADMVELGAVVYAALAVATEGGIRMVFWAIEQWRQDRERHRQELVEEISVQAKNQVFDDMLELSRQQPEADLQTLVAAARDQEREVLLPPRNRRWRRFVGLG